ncbi:MAG: hypothetical protein ACPG5W_12305, partial [Flavobacteriales bacterium]
NTGPTAFSTLIICPVTNATYCYENNTTDWVDVYVSTPGDYMDITFNSGSVENTYDELLVYDGAGGTGTQLYFGYGASGDVSGVTAQSTTGVISFAVQGDVSNSCGSGGQTQIDYSVVCSAPPSCLSPSALTATNTTTDGATISWTASGSSPTSYDYYVSDVNVAPTGGTAATGSVAGTTVVLSGYPQHTLQYVWVRADCGGGDFSTWTGPTGFYPLLENDLCSNATVLTCGTTALFGSSIGSVIESPIVPWFMSDYGVWYTFEGTGFDMTVSVDAAAGYDHGLGIGTGSCGAINVITEEDAVGTGGTESYTFNSTTAGENYYVYVAHYNPFSSIAGDFTISLSCDANVWTGAIDSDWGTNGNWSNGSVPTISDNASIPAAPSGGNFPNV